MGKPVPYYNIKKGRKFMAVNIPTVPATRGNITSVSTGITPYLFHTSSDNDMSALNNFFHQLYSFDWLNSDKTVHALSSTLSLHYLPIVIGNWSYSSIAFICVGAQQFQISDSADHNIHKPANRFKIFSECTITIPHPYDNYLDYPPYTRVVLHLPFIGDREIDHTPFLQQSGEYKGKIYVWWSVDVYSGDLTCFLADHNKYVYASFTGNCAVRFPLSAADFSQQAAGAAQAVTGAITTIGGIIAENPMVATMGMMSTGAGLVKAFQPPRTMINGSITGAHGYEGIWHSYATVTRPKFTDSDAAQGYPVKGKPCHKYVSLLGLSGFTKIAEIKLWNFPGQKSELEECLALLKEGVIL